MALRLALFALLLMTVLLTRGTADSPTLVAVTAGSSQATTHYDLGDVSQGGATPLTHTFLLRNNGTRPLTIDRFQPSCHCTSAVLVPDGPLPMTLAPGAQAAVRVSVVVEPYLSGPLDKFVQVYTAGQESPLATLALDARLRPLAVLDPLTLDFGPVPAGQSRSLTLTAAVDPRLAPNGAAPSLVSSDPDLHIAPLPASSRTHTYSYRVTLAPDAALGPVQALLQFARSARAPEVAGLTLADGPGVLVMGSVVGQAAATPTALAFGIVTRGHTVVVPVLLTAGNRLALASARAASSSPFVLLRWTRETPRTRVLAVILSASAPPGSVQSQVTVTLTSGQRLRLPLTAYVTAP